MRPPGDTFEAGDRIVVWVRGKHHNATIIGIGGATNRIRAKLDGHNVSRIVARRDIMRKLARCDHMTDDGLSRAYRHNETWLTDNTEDEITRMRRAQDFAAELDRRGLARPEIRASDYLDDDSL